MLVMLMLILYGSLCVVSACVVGAACVVSQRTTASLQRWRLAQRFPRSRPPTLHLHEFTKASPLPRPR